MQEINKTTFDMATVAKAIDEYSGEDKIEINVWLKEVILMGDMAELDEQALAKLIVLKLRGNARSYAITLINGDFNSVSLSYLLEGLRKRFANSKTTDEILNKFLATTQTNSHEEYLNLLHNATILFERDCINMKSLLKQTISKSPPEIKSLLYQYACSANDWNSFIKEAEEVSWLPFPEKTICPVTYENRQNERRQADVKTQRSRLICLIHGKRNHSTERCFTIMKLEKNGWKRVGTVREIKEEVNNELLDLNKFSNIYSCASFSTNPNPFFI